MENGYYHCHASIVSRGKAQSAVAHAAYISGDKLFSEYDEYTKDFTRKTHVVHREILLPKYAPQEYLDRETLWNAVEKFETRNDAQLGREIEFALPKELSEKEHIKAARQYADFFRKQGMICDFCIHEPDHGCPNPHCHLFMTMRPLNQQGEFVKTKCWREYTLDKNGNKILNDSGTDYKFKKRYAKDWDNHANIKVWRKKWEEIENHFYEQAGLDIRVSADSYEEQGVDLIPTIHMGADVTAMERKGIRTYIGDMNRAIKEINGLTQSLAEKERSFEKTMEALLYQKSKYEKLLLQEKKQKPVTVVSLLTEWQSNRAKFIQERGIHQRISTKTDNLQDFAKLVAFVQDKGITSLDDLEKLRSELMDRKTECIKATNENAKDVKDLKHRLDVYGEYKNVKTILVKYEGLEGKAKEKFYEKNAEAIERATTYRIGLKNMGGGKIIPNEWKSQLNNLTSQTAKAKADYASVIKDLDTLADITEIATRVYSAKTKAVEQEKKQEHSQQKRKNEQSL